MTLTTQDKYNRFYGLLNDLSKQHPDEYADINVIYEAILNNSAVVEIMTILPGFINVESSANDVSISTYDAIVKDSMKAIRDDFDSFFYLSDENPEKMYHNTNFCKTKVYADLLSKLSIENDKIKGQGLVDTSTGIESQMLTYADVVEIVNKIINE